jgi:DNA-directed RNA polymerase subunit K/omega
MLYPSIEALCENKYNRYELVIATAKCARSITEIQAAKQKEIEAQNARELTDKVGMRKPVKEVKAVKTAILKIYQKDYLIKTHR